MIRRPYLIDSCRANTMTPIIFVADCIDKSSVLPASHQYKGNLVPTKINPQYKGSILPNNSQLKCCILHTNQQKSFLLPTDFRGSIVPPITDLKSVFLLPKSQIYPHHSSYYKYKKCLKRLLRIPIHAKTLITFSHKRG